MNRTLRKLIIAVVALIIAFGYEYYQRQTGQTHLPAEASAAVEASSAPEIGNQQQLLVRIRDAAENQKSGWWLTTEAKVIKVLKDDNHGSRHQRFLIRLAQDITLLVAHNIDLAPRVPLQINDMVRIRGRYEWNHKGGVLHWTHHDPKGRQKGGWIFYRNRYYK